MPKMQFVSFIQRRIYVIGKARSLAPTFLGLKLKWTIACAATHYYTQALLGQPSPLSVGRPSRTPFHLSRGDNKPCLCRPQAR